MKKKGTIKNSLDSPNHLHTKFTDIEYNTGMKILLVEDEETIREVERAYLERAGHTVIEASDGEMALWKFKRAKMDLVVLDLNIPKKDGLEVCKELRELSNVPIIMVTARVEEIDEITGLEYGADDYLKKPFSPNILVARVESLLRRVGKQVLVVGDITIDPEKMEVTKKKKGLTLTTTQFNILYTLASEPGKVFTRDELIKHGYDDIIPRDVYDRTIDAHIKGIRKQIEADSNKPKYIQTVIGKGYKFNDQ